MKAAYIDTTSDGIRTLKYGDLEKPRARAGEALVRVAACGLNHLDIWLLKRDAPTPHVPGSDVAGVIEEIYGESQLCVGDQVIINPAIPCRECPRCKEGKPCEKVKIVGAKTWGGYAEYVVAPIEQLYSKPINLSFIEAAAFPLTFLTAWHMLVGRAQLQKGETVFIWGASGSLGSAAIQIAKYLGATVIAAARTQDAAVILKKWGADKTVIYTEGDVVAKVQELTHGQGVDIVFESVGATTWQISLGMLRYLGRLVIAGTTSGDIASQDLSELYVRQLTILGARMGTHDEFKQVLGAITRGELKPVVDKVFPLPEAAKAQEHMEAGKHFGKIVLQVDGMNP